MKIASILKIFTLSSFISLSNISINTTSKQLLLTPPQKNLNASNEVTTDYNAFAIRGYATSSPVGTISASITSIDYLGAWDSNFAISDQFDTRANNYSLKTHVYNSSWSSGDDMGTGFCIYYNDNNYITFVLKWTGSNTITDAYFLNHVNGNTNEVYASALMPDGEFKTQGTFNSVSWLKEDGSEISPSGNTVIDISVGFDMSMYVERTTYKDRVIDAIYFKLDIYEADGITPLTIYTPKYAIDAMSAPLGVTSSIFYQKPQIGFMNYNMTSAITYSDIEFNNLNSDIFDTKMTRMGTTPTKGYIDLDNNALIYNNNNFNTSFLTFDLVTSSTSSLDLEAKVIGSKGNENDTQLGFVYYFDESNYATFYLKWNGSLDTIYSLVGLIKVDGKTNNVTYMARNPWETELKETNDCFNGEFIEAKTDYSGWISDSNEPMYQYNNFNNFQSQNTLTISSGFTFGFQRIRTSYANKEVDAFQVRVSAIGIDNIYHNWYSPTICIDAFTYPCNSDIASSNKDKAPIIGFYAYNTNEITLSDIKYNGKEVNLSYSDLESARNFVNRYMHMDDYTENKGYCKDNDHHYYSSAKEGWEALSEEVRAIITNEEEFDLAYKRLLAWARANNDNLDSTITVNTNLITKSDKKTPLSIITLLSLLTITGTSSILIFTKKKEN